MAILAVFAMRGLGIPVTYEFTPLWDQFSWGHGWNSVRDNNGGYISFMGCETNPGVSHIGTTLPKSKVYRHVYAYQQNIASDKANIPPLLQNVNNIIDVTSKYGFCSDIWFPLKTTHLSKTGYVFLSVLQDMKWYPVAWSTVDAEASCIQFQSVSKGCLYLPVYYHNGVQTPASYPFELTYNGCRFFEPLNTLPRSFKGVAPVNYEWLPLMKDGRFEVANRSDFSDAQTVHTIKTVPGIGYQTVPVRSPSAYRYIRYVSPVGGLCTVSILEFYDENNEKLQGTAIGSHGASGTVFDGDVDTFYEANSDPSWIGLDFGEPRRITKIRYLPRTNGNGIYEGHEYELFYWNGNEWSSLGRKTADSHILRYKSPANALFYLKNITKNRIHKKPFTIESGVQRWF
jgi:hypothetical protein